MLRETLFSLAMLETETPLRHWSMISFQNDLLYFIITPPLIHMNSIIKGDDAQSICGEIRIFDFDKMFFALKNEI